MASAKAKLVRQMTRKDFEAVKLNKDQKKSLMSMVDSKYPQMVQFDKQIARSIPEEEVKALQRAYRKAEKGGSSETEAMSISMEKIGLPEMVQKKVMMMNQSKEDLRNEIVASLVESFDQEQQAAFASAMAAKKEMMDKDMADEKEMSDEGMKDKEMAGEKEMSGKEEMPIKEEMTAAE